jgi:hypothetical protein
MLTVEVEVKFLPLIDTLVPPLALPLEGEMPVKTKFADFNALSGLHPINTINDNERYINLVNVETHPFKVLQILNRKNG